MNSNGEIKIMAIYNWLNRTMVIERLSGVVVFTLVLAVVCLLLMNARTAKRVNFLFNVYLVVLCILAFFYIPGPDEDLWRIREYANSWIKLDFRTFFKSYVINSSNPSANLFIYFCSLPRIDGILPMACALIYYGNAFYIFKDLYNRHRYSAKSLAVALLFLMATGNFLQIISNVRTFAAMSIIARCIYDETMNGKPVIRNVFWYLVAGLTHAIVLVTCILRFIWLLLSRTPDVQKRIRNVLVAIVVFAMVYLFGKKYIDAAIYKAMGYLEEEVYSFAWSYLISGIVTFAVLVTCVGSHQKISAGLRDMRGYLLMVIAIACILAFEYSIFHRLTLFASLMVVPYMARRVDTAKKNNFVILVFLCSLAMLAVSVTRGNLSGYKFFLTSW